MNAVLLEQKIISLEQSLLAAQQFMAALQKDTAQTISGLQKENEILRQKMQALLKRCFGASSESIDAAQLELLLAGVESQVVPQPRTAAPPARPGQADRKKAVRRPLPAHLPLEKVTLEPDAVKANPQAWKKIGEEITEELDYQPGQFIRRQYIRPKYVLKETPLSAAGAQMVSQAVENIYGSQPEVVLAPLPARLIDKGLPGPGLLAHITLSRFEDHLPYFRLAKIFWERAGVDIKRQSLVDWIEKVAQWLKPVYDAMKEGLLAGDYLQVDETPLRYLDPDLPGKSYLGYLWAYSRPRAEIIFEWKISRGREGPEIFLQPFGGLLQTDGYVVYESLAKERAKEKKKALTLLGCWAHARRKFCESAEQDRRAAWFVLQIGHLYAIERRLRAQKAGPDLRQAVRAVEAVPILRRLDRAMDLLQKKVLPKSLLGEAIGYTRSLWTELGRYVEHGRAEIDNNLVENAIRPTALGKKNFLFIGHPEAGWRSAVIYSVLGSCRRLGINPQEYLSDILRRLPEMKITEIKTITPAAWAKARKEAARKSQPAQPA